MHERLAAPKHKAAELLGAPVPARPPGFCVGCPERPVFSAMKLIERETGAFHVSADIGCHTFSTLPPFNIGNTVLGYGLGLASNAAVDPMFGRRTVTIMGDGGFWHNGLTSGVANAVFNKDDGILRHHEERLHLGHRHAEHPLLAPPDRVQVRGHEHREARSTGVGVKWMKTVYNYRVADMAKTLKEAMTTAFEGLKVIIADGECQLERQRRMRPLNAELLRRGERVVRDALRRGRGHLHRATTPASGCRAARRSPSSPRADPLKVDPVAHVNNDCVGCGLCGEVAHAAILCPSFFRAEIVQNPSVWDRLLDRVRQTVIGWLQPA